ncbi:pyridoxamine 5'-phosphate oxidase family protein [Trebonia sp.]|uniref:pyridoxamine 5'-phosphate oxidase family protein n=1 Tax=Trebonia sp. TaxID=2767075 RepID=UPI003CC5BF51
MSATARTRHRRYRHLGRADRESLDSVLDAGLVAHLGVITGGWPMVVPTVYGFTADTLYLHGSVASQSLNTAGTPVCVTITLTDGLVLARSAFEHTINYRSAMIYGQPRLVTDPAERLAGLRTIAEHVAPGQWDYARRPSRKELAAVRLLALPLEEASVKIRTGPPSDGDTPDAALGLWAGELPLATTWQQPIPDPALPPGIAVPAHIRSRAGTRAGQSTNSTPES